MPGKVKVSEGLRGQVDSPRVITMDWVADSVDGTIPETNTPVIHGRVDRIVTVPGEAALAPTDYDVAIMDSDQVDILAGQGAARLGAARGQILFQNPVAINTALTLSITGQTNTGASGKVVIYLDRSER